MHTFIIHISTVQLRLVNYYGDVRTSQTKRWRRCMFLFFLCFKTNCKKNLPEIILNFSVLGDLKESDLCRALLKGLGVTGNTVRMLTF